MTWTSCVAYRFTEWSTLADCDLVAFLNAERRRNMRSQVLVALLVSRVLGDKVEVFTTDDESSVHFGRDDGACKDTSTDGDQTSEGAFLI